MHVIQIAPCFVDLERETGGVANVVRQLALASARSGYKTTLICGDRELNVRQAAPGSTSVTAGVTKIVLPLYRVSQLGPSYPVRKLILEMDLESPGAVAHVHTCFSAMTETAMFGLARRQVPFVFSPHGKLSSGMLAQRKLLKTLWWTAVAQRAVGKASIFGALAPAEEEAARELNLNMPSVRIPNGYDMSIEDARYSQSGQPYILFLSYLDPRKRPELLIRAYAASRSRLTHELHIAGPDKYGLLADLQALVHQEGLSDRVKFLGGIYGPRKWAHLKAATVLCLPSLAEGLPVVLVESIAASTPSIFSRQCNFSELARTGGGIELDSNDPQAWADAMDLICGDRGKREEMSAMCKSVAPMYSWSNVTASWLAIYKQLAQS